jgi:hypothetical protein
MQIRTTILPSQSRYDATIALDPVGEPISGREQDALRQFGDMVIDFGGSFTQGQIAFTLPTDMRAVPLQLPVKQRFSIADYSDDTAAVAGLWASTVEARITNALADLLNKETGTIGSAVKNLAPVADPSTVTGDVQVNDWMDLS